MADEQMVREIPLTKGRVALVDVADYESLKMWHWVAWWSPEAKTFYARRNFKLRGKQKTVYMSREILHVTDPTIYVDHKSGDTLDNRRANLRIATNAQNQHNQKVSSKSKTGYKGVFWVPRDKRFRVSIRKEGKRYSGGDHTTLEAAVEARRRLAERLHGEFAREL